MDLSEKITRRVQLNYPLERVKEPVLYHLVMDYGLIPNIRRAQIDFHTGGFIVLELTGEAGDLDRGIRFLEECGVTVAEVGLNSDGEWEA
jgi:L-aspartate semialdehyde sulfurtransferase ferredoxin